MTPRRRSKSKRGWPQHLYERGGYYSWRNPLTGEELGIGRDRAEAFTQAIEANLHVLGMLRRERLVDRIVDSQERTVERWFAKYAEMLAKRTLAANTRRSYKSLSKRSVELLKPDTKLRAITALQVTEVLEGLEAAGTVRLAQALRGFLREAFRVAIVQGWLDDNPVRDVRGTEAVVVKRARLTLPVFMAVYRSDIAPWLRNAMALGIVAAQRREDICNARFADIRDGAWWVEQGKTGARVAIPLDIRLDVFGMSLEEVVKQCRNTGVLSKHLVHQTSPRGNSPVGQPIWVDTLSRRFSAALAALKLDFESKDPPTFHEIRSLAERLYAAQGNVKTQELLGHKDPKTTSIYHDPRGEWIRVRVGTV